MKCNRFFRNFSHAMYTNPGPKMVLQPYRPNVKGVPPPPSRIFTVVPPAPHGALRPSALASR